MIEMNIVKVEDGHIIHHGQLFARLTAKVPFRWLRRRIIPFQPIFPDKDAKPGRWSAQEK
jgi:hypothetical protein